jgi:putative ABC transport system substrate-binding protein
MMIPRVTLFLLLAALATGGAAAAERVARVLVLVSHDAEPYQKALSGLGDRLKAVGVAASLDVVRLQGDGNAAKAAFNARAASPPDVIVALGSIALQAPRANGVSAPVVAALVMSEREIEAVPDATGVVLEFPVQTELEWVRRFVPERDNVAVIFNADENRERVDAAAAAAGKIGLRLHASAVVTPRDLPAELEDVGRHADVIWGIPDQIAMTPQTAKPILLFSFRNRIPVVGLSTSWVKAGALYALDRDYTDVGAQAAELVRKVLDGASAKSIAPLPPRKAVYAINLKTARHMKLDLPDELVKGAAEVIE